MHRNAELITRFYSAFQCRDAATMATRYRVGRGGFGRPPQQKCRP